MRKIGMSALVEALRDFLIAEGQVDGRKVYHFLLPNGKVVELVV